MIALRRFTREDFPRLIGWIPDVRFLLQWGGPGYSFPLDAKQLADNQWEAETDPPRKFIFKAVSLPEEQVVGHIELVRHRDDPARGRLARVLIGPEERRGEGLGTEMILQTLRFGFEQLEMPEIDLAVFTFNRRAIACYEKIGFRQTEFMAGGCEFEGEPWDGYRMKLTRAEWLAAKKRG